MQAGTGPAGTGHAGTGRSGGAAGATGEQAQGARGAPTDLRTPVRNHYFYGKLLDAFHFNLETDYHNAKRWMLNRRVLGYGVVCGLDVQPGPEPNEVTVTPGIAIDRHGRELIVPRTLGPVAIPPWLLEQATPTTPKGRRQREEPVGLHVVLCYHECLDEPTRVLAGECQVVEPCQPDIVREQVRVEFRAGLRRRPAPQCLELDFIQGTRLNWQAVVEWVTRECPRLSADPCLPLANITLDPGGGHGCNQDNVDITVRPIVFGNDLLFELLMSVAVESPRTVDEK
jgi:hypothetical protein